MELKKGISVRYKVDEKNRCIVAYATGTKYNAIDAINKYFDAHGSMFLLYRLSSKEFNIPDNFIGIAKCHKDDIFNIEEGKRIAKAKLYKKYDKSLHKAYRRFIKYTNNIMIGFEKCVEKFEETLDTK